MSSDLSVSGGPTASQDCGPVNLSSNTTQNEISGQTGAVPSTPEVASENSDLQDTVINEVTSATEKLDPKPIMTPPNNEGVHENKDLCSDSTSNEVIQEKSVASGFNSNASAEPEVQSQSPPEAEKKLIKENTETNEPSSQNEIEEVKQPVVNEKNPTSLKNESKESSATDEEAVFLDAQEIAEQIIKILDDGKSEILSTPQELMRKNVELQEFILKLIQVLKEKTDLCANLERQNTALISQAQSLKDVISITKDLLGIRNMEVEHLHADMASMETRIKEERLRHNTAVTRLNEAMQLNDKLKTEYLVQMDLFQKLREKYNEKVVILTKENQRLKEIVKNNGLENIAVPEEFEEKCNSENAVLPEEVSEENVDK